MKKLINYIKEMTLEQRIDILAFVCSVTAAVFCFKDGNMRAGFWASMFAAATALVYLKDSCIKIDEEQMAFDATNRLVYQQQVNKLIETINNLRTANSQLKATCNESASERTLTVDVKSFENAELFQEYAFAIYQAARSAKQSYSYGKNKAQYIREARQRNAYANAYAERLKLPTIVLNFKKDNKEQ